MISELYPSRQIVGADERKLFASVWELFRELNKEEGFPFGYCQYTADLLYRKFGFEPVSGYFLIDNPKLLPPEYPSVLFQDHLWNTMDDGRIIDLTASQFNAGLKDSLPQGILIIDPLSKLGSRYKAFDKNI